MIIKKEREKERKKEREREREWRVPIAVVKRISEEALVSLSPFVQFIGDLFYIMSRVAAAAAAALIEDAALNYTDIHFIAKKV